MIVCLFKWLGGFFNKRMCDDMFDIVFVNKCFDG